MLKLFAVSLGGMASGCNLELHDTVFIITDNIDDSYNLIVQKWFGIPSKVHIDAYVEVSYVDGYEISIANSYIENEMSLFFVNMGGYIKDYLGEIHLSKFIIAKNLDEAKVVAKNLPKPDDSYSYHLDNIISLNKIDDYFIQIKKCEKLINTKLDIHAQYKKLIAKI